MSLIVLDNFDLSISINTHTRVSGAKIDSDSGRLSLCLHFLSCQQNVFDQYFFKDYLYFIPSAVYLSLSAFKTQI
jgi:hypothetical protein